MLTAASVALMAMFWSAPGDGEDLVRRGLAAEAENRSRQVNYLFVEHIVRRAFDKKRQTTSRQESAFEVLYLEGKPAYRRVRINNRPLTTEEDAQESARLRQLAEDRRRNPEIASPADDRRRGHPFARFPLYHQFRFAGEQNMDGRDCWVVDSEPKPGRPKPATRDDRAIASSTARFWLDKETMHRVRMDVTALKPTGAAKVREYTSYRWAQRDGQVWLIVEIRTVLPLDGDGNTVAYYESLQTYSDYRRFTSESNLTVVEELGKTESQQP